MTLNPELQVGEHETKFTFPNRNAVTLKNWLSQTCLPDPEYSEGIISSIYFDTSHFHYLREKLSSDYLKTKFRLRWYSSVNTRAPFPALFMEAKFKIGSARKKIRILLDQTSNWVIERELNHPDFNHLDNLFRQKGVPLNSRVLPVFQISYKRNRFIEPYSKARISVDSDIHVPRWNQTLLRGRNLSLLPTAVFEFKEKTGTLPDHLAPGIAIADARRSSFSKYSECFAHFQGITY